MEATDSRANQYGAEGRPRGESYGLYPPSAISVSHVSGIDASHFDGGDKLKMYGFPYTMNVDGWSH